MMREIKFRVWDEACNAYVTDGNWKLYLAGGVSIADCWATKDAVIEQYTGLTDKNGVEIYENDIVEHHGQARRVDYLTSIGGWALRAWPRRRRYTLNDHTPVEVIGNIHQNPELLDKQE